MSEPSADDLKALAEARLEDSRVLLQAQRHAAAYYLAGYAVECALKAIIAYSFHAAVIPSKKFVNDIYVHDLAKLVRLAGLENETQERGGGSADFLRNWAIVAGWSEAVRYEIVDSFKATAMVEAVSDEEHGVLPWLKSHWTPSP